MQPDQTVRICQNSSCCKFGSKSVLAAFQQLAPSNVTVEGCRCFGQCGNGPMVLVLPEQVWYDRVSAEEVSAIVTCHLINGQPIKSMLYQKFHR